MNDNSDNTGNSQDDHEEKEEKGSGILEKIFTVLSIVLLITLAGFLIRQSLEPVSPPSFKIEAESAVKRGEFLAMEVKINNLGDDAAKAVQIRGEATGADGEPAEAEATLDWLPGKSKRKVTLIFPIDADTSKTQIRITGYEEP